MTVGGIFLGVSVAAFLIAWFITELQPDCSEDGPVEMVLSFIALGMIAAFCWLLTVVI